MPLAAPPPIESARLHVRPVAESDLPALMEVNGDEEVTRFLPYATWKSMADAQAWLERMSGLQATGTTLQLVIARKDTGKAIGTCLLFRFDEGSARAELGYVLGRAHWSKGYMREALAALIDCAFGSMGLRRLEAAIDPSNVSSARLLRGLGFTREGLLRQRWLDEGQPGDEEVYGLLRHESRSIRDAAGPMPRIAPIDPPYPPELQAEFDKLMRGAPPLLLFRTVARNPRVLQRMMAGGLLDRGSISLRSRELAILRTCARCGAEYEWGVHIATFGDKAQWTPAQVHSTVHGSASDGCWSPEDALVIRLADQLHDTNRADDALWKEISAHFAPDQLVELIMLAGLYHAVSYLTNAIGIQKEAFAPGFP
jgi:RimJ/RimL family protein N-acetyltransferase/alkylhydroperoxidase family enzyme